MSFHSARSFRSVAIVLFAVALATPAWSQTPAGSKQGGFVGVAGLPKFTFGGETFDGVGAYQLEGTEEIIILPKLDEQPLVRAILGYRARRASLEVSYDRTRHDGIFENTTAEATIQAINVDGRLFFLSSTRVQPHVLVGGSFPWVRIKNGSILDPVTGELGDARYRGYGLNTEVGVTVFPHPRFGIGGGYSYRLMWFDRATGVSDTFGELRPRFREEVRGVVVTLMLVL